MGSMTSRVVPGNVVLSRITSCPGRNAAATVRVACIT
jgi:hypothetical protein